ncbi:hypothetical protein ACFLXU_04230 [Chloroflexota bacterium]
MPDISKNSKSYRTSAILFVFSGVVLIVVSILGDKIYLLPIGIALLVVAMGIWRQSHKIKETEQDNSSEVNQ